MQHKSGSSSQIQIKTNKISNTLWFMVTEELNQDLLLSLRTSWFDTEIELQDIIPNFTNREWHHYLDIILSLEKIKENFKNKTFLKIWHTNFHSG